jgi:N-acetylmuramoyl-L-alanine amidase
MDCPDKPGNDDYLLEYNYAIARYMQILSTYRSPNFDSRNCTAISILVMHYTGMPSAEAALQRLSDTESNVSAHYVVDEDGSVYGLVDEAMRAWHAGKGSWRSIDNVNAASIGIEIVNPGHEFGYRPFPKPQMNAVAALAKAVMGRHGIAPRNVIAHSDLAPERKEDPGELFDWEWLAGQGVGLWPDVSGLSSEFRVQKIYEESAEAEIRLMQQALYDYGYPVPVSGSYCDFTRKCVIAFQRHFRPTLLSGIWDRECAARLASLQSKS